MHIPNEIHDLILSDLRLGDYPDYRLVSHSSAQAAIPHVFSTVEFSPKVSSLRNLARIASQEHLSRHVKHLKWNSNHFATRNEEAQVGFGNKEWEAVREVLHRGAQESEGHADTGMRILTLILRHFPNLKTLRISIYDNPGPTERRLDPSDRSSMIRGEYLWKSLENREGGHTRCCRCLFCKPSMRDFWYFTLRRQQRSTFRQNTSACLRLNLLLLLLPPQDHLPYGPKHT
jgi:hypothetical protein